MEREEIRFRSGAETCAGWLYRPAPSDAPTSCVVLAHGFGVLKEARLEAYAERFASGGHAALVFDYRHFGESGGEPRQLLDVRRQHEDWRAAVAYARAARGGRSAAHRPLGELVQRIPIVAVPGELGAMTSPDARPGYSALYPEGFSWRNEVAARIALRVGLYSPGRKAGQVRCPLRVQVATDDAVTPPEPARKAARAAPRGELKEYPGGHFDVYLGDLFQRVVADQLEFLDRHLTAGR